MVRPVITAPVPWLSRPAAEPAKAIATAKRPKKGPATLRPVRPNEGLRAMYRRRLDRLVDEMCASVEHWVRASYRANEPEVAVALAEDALPSSVLRKAVQKLARRWLKRFDEAAPQLAAWFAQATQDRSDADLKAILRQAGYSVRFKMTPAARDVMQATIGEQVGLIKSIPQKYLGQVEGMVMRSVAAGRDLSTLSKDLQREYGVTKRRAAFIARSQNNVATANITRVRQIELGITQAIWVHSGGGKEPRPTHVKAGREKTVYDVAEGWYDPHENKRIWPGQLPNCRCVARAVVKGFS